MFKRILCEFESEPLLLLLGTVLLACALRLCSYGDMLVFSSFKGFGLLSWTPPTIPALATPPRDIDD